MDTAPDPPGRPDELALWAHHFPVAALSRATSSELIPGNAISLQFDGPATFETWIEAIEKAERSVHFENYVVRNDRTGTRFRDAMVERARAGVAVHVLYDWVGCWATPRRYWKPLVQAGAQVRAFNRPALRDPLRVLQRDHRKLVCVDGQVAYVGGFCVGDEWAGKDGAPPWRDTGVEIRGPAAAAAGATFERAWASMGSPVAEENRTEGLTVPEAGESAVWVIQGQPWRSRVYRATQLIAASAKQTLWITDPYFVAPRPVSEALAAAARDGVDVRILVPAHNNWPWVGSLSRGGYRALLRSGARIFEWQGPMIHAKTMVADGCWCRIGSSNLNWSSLLGNWEIDIAVLDHALAGQLEGLFLADLATAVEIVLPGSRSPVASAEVAEAAATSLEPQEPLHQRLHLWRTRTPGSGLTVADVVRAGSTLGDALAGSRLLGREDRTVLGTVATSLLIAGVVAASFPRITGWVLAAILVWLGASMGIRALAQRRLARQERNAEPAPGVEQVQEVGDPALPVHDEEGKQ
ncbi:MAG: cardiolipin synthase B [Gemmatimonadetes bacterium]|nr:cardiolipin synthase B [Gemmatimonadota bacterium]